MPNGGYHAFKPLAKSDGWQTVEIGLEDLTPMEERSPQGPQSWRTMTELGIVATRQLKNLRWVGGEHP